MRCALVETVNNIVENIIIADPSVDPAPTGYILIGLADDSSVSVGWYYDPLTGGFYPPVLSHEGDQL